MTEMIRCPACRGTKKVPKLGGMIGDCNTCKAKGQINIIDKPKAIIIEPIEPVENVIKEVAESVPATSIEEDIKVDPKRALYKRKRA